MITKTSLFIIRNENDALRAQNIMEKIACSKDPEEREVFEIFDKLIEAWSLTQPQMEAPEPYEVIRATLELRDISQKDLARMIGTSEPAISAILNERRHLSIKLACKIAQALGLSIENLHEEKFA